jgi:hypothetical protein
MQHFALFQTETLDLGTWGLMYYNNLFGLPVFLLLFVFTELDQVLAFPLWSDGGFLVRTSRLAFFYLLGSATNSPQVFVRNVRYPGVCAKLHYFSVLQGEFTFNYVDNRYDTVHL